MICRSFPLMLDWLNSTWWQGVGFGVASICGVAFICLAWQEFARRFFA